MWQVFTVLLTLMRFTLALVITLEWLVGIALLPIAAIWNGLMRMIDLVRSRGVTAMPEHITKPARTIPNPPRLFRVRSFEKTSSGK